MPDKEAARRARADKREGKSPSTQAGEFVREEIHEIRKGEHGARSAKQAVAIGLNKARRAGVDLPPPKKGKTSEKTRKSAEAAHKAGQEDPGRRASPTRSRATTNALKRETTRSASTEALSRQGRSAARSRTAADRSAAARKAAATKGPHGRHEAALKAAQTRRRRTRGGT